MSKTNGKEKSQPPERNAQGTPSFATTIDTFTQHVRALEISFSLVMLLMRGNEIVRSADFLSFLEHYCEKVQDESGERSFTVPPTHLRTVDRLSRECQHASVSSEILPRAFLISLVSGYDYYLGRLLNCLFRARPELLNVSEKSMTYGKLMEFHSMNEAKEYLIEKEIESVLRESHADQFDWMESKFAIKLRENLPAWQPFIELTERRNLFAHCNGVVSSQYQTVCKMHKVAPLVHKVGDQLNVDSKYFISACACIYEIGVKLAHVLWRKVVPEDRSTADDHLNNLLYHLLTEEKNEMAIVLGQFAVETVKKHASERVRRMMIINLAQAYKWSNKLEDSRALIEQTDWTACGEDFLIATAVLSDDFEKAARLMNKTGPRGAISEEDYLDWPLFKEFRRSEVFLTSYQETFGKPFAPVQKAPARRPITPDYLRRLTGLLRSDETTYSGPEGI